MLNDAPESSQILISVQSPLRAGADSALACKHRHSVSIFLLINLMSVWRAPLNNERPLMQQPFGIDERISSDSRHSSGEREESIKDAGSPH